MKFDVVSFCVPSRFVFVAKSGIDLHFWEYSAPEITIRVYVGPQSPTDGAYAQSKPTFRKERLFVDEVFTTTWYFNDEPAELPHVFGARYYIDGTGDGNASSIFVRTTDSDLGSLIDSVFKSFRLEKRE